jgi:hypothetical protein
MQSTMSMAAQAHQCNHGSSLLGGMACIMSARLGYFHAAGSRILTVRGLIFYFKLLFEIAVQQQDQQQQDQQCEQRPWFTFTYLAVAK